MQTIHRAYYTLIGSAEVDRKHIRQKDWLSAHSGPMTGVEGSTTIPLSGFIIL
jgi:hypothetical protein